MRQLKEDKSIPVSEMNIRYEALAKELKALKRHRTVMEEAEQNRWNG